MNQAMQAADQEQLIKQVFLSDQPLIDVRAPVEFQQGAFPSATNLPILEDEERHEIGVCYKQKGPDKATALGHEIVSGRVKQTRLNAWLAFIETNPTASLYCFRGGQRSQITESWLNAAGADIKRIPGGYKAMRRFLLGQFEQLPELRVLSGRTGTGKTDLLVHVKNMVDLEERANHRGSAFGNRLTPQPAQIDFENSVAIDFLKLSSSTVMVEDESRLIGRVHLPPELQAAMKQAPIFLLEDTVSNRVDRIHLDYIEKPWQELVEKNQDPYEYMSSKYLSSITAIKKRLGGERHEHLHSVMSSAFKSQRQGDSKQHKVWIERLLVDYYDPMYDYQLSKKQDRVTKTGDFETLKRHFESNAPM